MFPLVIAALNAGAALLGLFRSECLRRRLAQEAVTAAHPVSVADLSEFAETLVDLTDAQVMDGAWE